MIVAANNFGWWILNARPCSSHDTTDSKPAALHSSSIRCSLMGKGSYTPPRGPLFPLGLGVGAFLEWVAFILLASGVKDKIQWMNDKSELLSGACPKCRCASAWFYGGWVRLLLASDLEKGSRKWTSTCSSGYLMWQKMLSLDDII